MFLHFKYHEISIEHNHVLFSIENLYNQRQLKHIASHFIILWILLLGLYLKMLENFVKKENKFFKGVLTINAVLSSENSSEI